MIRITSKTAGFRRCGVAHPAAPTDYPDDRFSREELKRLRTEPMLTVEIVEEEITPKDEGGGVKDEGGEMKDEAPDLDGDDAEAPLDENADANVGAGPRACPKDADNINTAKTPKKRNKS